MRKLLLAVLLSGLAGAAFAQMSGSSTSTTTTTTFSPAWNSEIKEYVVKEKTVHIPPPPGWHVAVGVPVPPSVELYSFPATAPYAKYRYSVIGDETVVVDPGDRKVIEVIR